MSRDRRHLFRFLPSSPYWFAAEQRDVPQGYQLNHGNKFRPTRSEVLFKRLAVLLGFCRQTEVTFSLCNAHDHESVETHRGAGRMDAGRRETAHTIGTNLRESFHVCLSVLNTGSSRFRRSFQSKSLTVLLMCKSRCKACELLNVTLARTCYSYCMHTMRSTPTAICQTIKATTACSSGNDLFTFLYRLLHP
jgi:hypothetical protein